MKMTISYCFDYLCRHFHSSNRKIWKFYLKRYKNYNKKLGFILKKCQKLYVVILSRDLPGRYRNKGVDSNGFDIDIYLYSVEMCRGVICSRTLVQLPVSATWFVVVLPACKALDSRYVGCYLISP